MVTDDRAARSSCLAHGVTFTGTIGVLKACCADGLPTAAKADEVLEARVDAGYDSPVGRISDLL